ncbi:MAG: UbiA family prenyltransferase [Verrucomicrobiaceae bacterium]|nr:UbiA family prenyltransferase [Verrucomicrobiaceae bacterium]
MTVRAWLELARISNLPTIWTNVLAAWLLAGHSADSALLQIIAGASLIYTAGMILNDAGDASWDRVNKPERPIPSGRVRLVTAWTVGLVALGLGLVVFWSTPGTHLTWLIALCTAVVAYDLFHKPWAGSVVVMGSCRTFLYLATGGIAVANAGTALGIYVIALSLLARAEGKGGLTTGKRALLVALLLVPVWTSLSANPFWLVSAVAFAALVWICLRQMGRGGPAIGSAVGWLLAGIPLVDALALASAGNNDLWVLALCLMPPALRYWQRFVSAT